MGNIKDQYDKIDKDLLPYWNELVRAVNAKGLMVTGFVWGDPVPESDTPYLVRFGNLYTATPHEMFAINYQLSVLAARLELDGQIERDLSTSNERNSGAAPQGPNPLEIADKLALSLLAVPIGDAPTGLLELLDQYLKMRRPIPEGGK